MLSGTRWLHNCVKGDGGIKFNFKQSLTGLYILLIAATAVNQFSLDNQTTALILTG